MMVMKMLEMKMMEMKMTVITTMMMKVRSTDRLLSGFVLISAESSI